MNSFGQHLSGLVNASLEAGVPPQEIVLVLEVTKIELVNRMLASAANVEAKPSGPLIVLPNQNGRQG